MTLQGNIGTIYGNIGLYRDTGKENGNHYNFQ